MNNTFDPVVRHNVLKPDLNAWLVPDFVAACKNLKNEFNLTLWEALEEYVNFHNPYCAFRGRAYEGELFLYPILEYNHQNRRATLKKLFYISKSVKTIFMYDYLKTPNSSPNNTPFFNILKRNTLEKFDDFPEIEFMVTNNNVEPALAKELLLKASFYRRSVKKAFVLENLSAGIEYKSTNIVAIDFDLSFLEQCSFLDAKRYEGFKKMLPKNLIISVGCKLDFDLPDIPRHLKQQQLLSIGSLST